MISPKLVEVGQHVNIEIITCSELDALEGEAGNFRAVLKNQPRYIIPEKCTACGSCQQVCPGRAINEFNLGLDGRAATFIRYPQAVPRAFAIDRNVCLGCGLCEKVCIAGAVKYDDQPRLQELKVGAGIVCPGFVPFDASQLSA